MSFWFNEPKIMIVLRQISRKLRFTLSVVTVIITGLIWALFFYYPMYQKNVRLNNKNHALFLQKQKLEQQIKKSQKLSKECSELKQKLSKHLDLKTQSENPVAYLMETMKKHDLVCTEMRPMKKTTKNNVCKQDYHLALKGSFQNLITFLHESSQSDIVIKYKAITINRQKNNKITCSINVRIVSNLMAQ